MKMLRKASLGFNFTGSYKKNSVIVGKRLCHRCFSAIHCNRCFPVMHFCITVHDTLQPGTRLNVWNTSINVRYGQDTVQLHFNSPSEI